MSAGSRYRHNSAARKYNPMAILIGCVVYWLSGMIVGDVMIVEIVGDVMIVETVCGCSVKAVWLLEFDMSGGCVVKWNANEWIFDNYGLLDISEMVGRVVCIC
ncbi:hypothetical protein CDL15_Pgr004910 [Punica granatum]|uniref:Transmembrane protein n=1 Tax=Punica granatum TaxID=22663 RepID=A0A218Y2N8_PUNGR|nr:hypothetical protein CDL15_Pgr004910 [Punica granatum]PKI38540.1 hypothetical protein CRG98_041069 [Punica granatum]